MLNTVIANIIRATVPKPFHVQLCKILIVQELKTKSEYPNRIYIDDLFYSVIPTIGCSQIKEISVVDQNSLPSKNVVDFIVSFRAFYEAIANLYSKGIIYPSSALHSVTSAHFGLQVTIAGTIHGGSLNLEDTIPWVSEYIIFASSDDNVEIYDPDLFLKSITSLFINDEIKDFLADAVQCFRSDLFRPAIVMLAAANEGVWIELGRRMATILPAGKSKSQKEGFSDEIENPKISIAAKQDLICETFSHLGSDKQKLWHKGELSSVKEFARYLREDRNALHYGKLSIHDDTFAKTAVLMLQTGAHIKRIYEIISFL